MSSQSIFLNKKEMLAEIIKSKQIQKEHEEYTVAQCLTPKLVEMLMLLVNNYAQSFNWRGYSYIDDMKSEALISLSLNALKFDPEHYDNPFGYYTQIARNAFLSYLDKEGKLRDVRDEQLLINDMNPSFNAQMENYAVQQENQLDGTKVVKATKRRPKNLHANSNKPQYSYQKEIEEFLKNKKKKEETNE